MNERMLDLAIQAKDWAYADHDGYTAQMLFEQKFAELIVQECIDIISPYTVRMSRPGEKYLHPIQEIRKNFGVE